MMDGNHNLSELPNGWLWAKLIEISAKLQSGGTPSTKVATYYENGTIPFVKIADMVAGDKFVSITETAITEEGLRNSSAWIVPTGSLLYSMYASYGVPIINKLDVATSQAIIAFIPPRDLLSIDYVYYYLLMLRSNLKTVVAAKGTTQDNLNAQLVSTIPVPLAPLPEQHRIVAKIEELFTKLDAGVAELKKAKAKLRRYRQSVLKAAVEGELTREWREAHEQELEPAAKLLERIRQARREKHVAKVKDGLRVYLRSRVQTTGIHDSPHVVLRDWLIEMVVKDVDRSHAGLLDRLTAEFLKADDGKEEVNERVAQYLRWARRTLDALIEHNLNSEILSHNLAAWAKCWDEQLRAADTMVGAFKQWTASLPDASGQGAKHLRRELMDEPAEQNWKRDEERRAALRPDTSRLQDLPEGWVCMSLGRCTDLITKGESPRWQGFAYVDDGIPFIRSENVLWGRVDISGVARIPNEFHSKLFRSQVLAGDVLVNLVGASIGRCGVVPANVTVANINQAVALVRTDDSLAPMYLMHLMISPQLQAAIRNSKVETARPNISLGDLRSLAVPLPAIAEQHAIVSEVERRLSIADEVEAVIAANLKRAERLRQSILKQAFSGKLVPQDPSDEPANVLLERIRVEKTRCDAEKRGMTRSRRPRHPRRGKQTESAEEEGARRS